MHGNRAPRSPWKVRYFLDTEFTDFNACELISIAIVGEDGREFYGECSDFDLPLCSDFVGDTVLPQLGQFPGRSMPFSELRKALHAWRASIQIKPKPILCYDFEGDHALIHNLLGSPMPRSWKTENVAQKLDAARLAEYVNAHGGAHHALHDARANAHAFR
jgi:hypothetical protein